MWLKHKRYFLVLPVILTLVVLTTHCVSCENDNRQRSGSLADQNKQEDEQDKYTAVQLVPGKSQESADEDSSLKSVDDKPADDRESTKPFVATNEWQTLEKDQTVPAGLHIRLNLATGQREAKLMDRTDRQQQQQPDLPSEGEHSVGETAGRFDDLKTALIQSTNELNENDKSSSHGRTGVGSFSPSELKAALKKLKSADHGGPDDQEYDVDEDEETAEVVTSTIKKKTKFRSMETLKHEFNEMGLNIKTDLELLTELLQRYNSTHWSADRVDELVTLLTDLEYYLHQIDNAHNFADMGGLQLIIRDLNSTSERVRGEAAFVLASAVQSNPKVQVAAIKHGAMHQLIRMLSVESHTSVRGRVLVAVSSLVRHFPFAQLKFLELGGLESLSRLLNDRGEAAPKLAIKALTLVNDLLIEKLLAYADEDGLMDEQREEKRRQYDRIHLLEAVVDQGWCEKISSLLEFPDHDDREKVLNAMLTLKESCFAHYVSAASTLHALKTEYATLAAHEMQSDDAAANDVYFSGLVQTIDILLSDLDTLRTARTEL